MSFFLKSLTLFLFSNFLDNDVADAIERARAYLEDMDYWSQQVQLTNIGLQAQGTSQEVGTDDNAYKFLESKESEASSSSSSSSSECKSPR